MALKDIETPAKTKLQRVRTSHQVTWQRKKLGPGTTKQKEKRRENMGHRPNFAGGTSTEPE